MGHLWGLGGAFVLLAGVAEPWLRLDGSAAFVHALSSKHLDAGLASRILSTFATPSERAGATPAAQAIAKDLGVEPTGLMQNHYVAAVVVVAALIALVAVLRSVTAETAWAARRPAPLLTFAAIAGLAAMGVTLWLLAPAPREAMRPAIGMWLVLGGSGALLVASATLGGNRRRMWTEDQVAAPPSRMFDGNEHLAYSNGAWVPRTPDGRR